MLISFTGEVTETKPALSGDTWLVRLKDNTDELVTVHCKHPTLRDAGRLLVIGQMVEVVGFGKRSSTATTVIPIAMYAKNGLKAADFNRMATEFFQGLASGEDLKAKAMIETQQVSIRRLQEKLDVATSDYQASQQGIKDSREEIERLRKSLDELDRELQYERTVNGALT